MRYIRVPVDIQNTFADARGLLTVFVAALTPKVLTNARHLIADACKNSVPVVGSLDSHSWDAWEYQENGGPFPGRHGLKGTWDALLCEGILPRLFRFIPMCEEGAVIIGEASPGAGNRKYSERAFAREAVDGVGLFFEKEVYSLFANPNAETMIEALVAHLGGKDEVTFQVFGYCLGKYCVDVAALKLREHGYNVQVVTDACQALDVGHDGNPQNGLAVSTKLLTDAGVELITTDEAVNLTNVQDED